MAKFFNDFLGTAINAAPAGWILSKTDFTNFRVISDSTAYNGRCLEITPGTVSGNFARWPLANTSPDMEMVLRFKVTDTGANHQFSVRVADATSCYPQYMGDVASSTTLRVSRRTTSYTTLNSVALGTDHALAANTWHWIRIRANGTSISSKTWKDSVSEPASWQVTATDSGVTTGGHVAMGKYNHYPLYVNFVGVGTQGDTAPKNAAELGGWFQLL